jgi:hypothetical protein
MQKKQGVFGDSVHANIVQAPPGVTHEIRVIGNFIAASYRAASPESISDIHLTVKVEHFLLFNVFCTTYSVPILP